MNWTEGSHSLRFEHRPRRLPHRAIAIGVALGILTLAWRLIPHSALYWLFLPLVAALLWVASYGWRQALAARCPQQLPALIRLCKP